MAMSFTRFSNLNIIPFLKSRCIQQYKYSVFQNLSRNFSSSRKFSTIVGYSFLASSFAPLKSSRSRSLTNQNIANRSFSVTVEQAKQKGWIVELNLQNFSILQASKVPVIIDCYADWCQPCKQLQPLLEHAVIQANGRLILAKLNCDENPQLSSQMRVSELPTVFGIFNNKLIDHFVGLVPPDRFNAFIKNLLANSPIGNGSDNPKAAIEQELENARMKIKDGDVEGATQDIKDLHKRLTENEAEVKMNAPMIVKCLIGLVECAIASGAFGDASELLKTIKNKHTVEISNDPKLAAALSDLELQIAASDTQIDTISLESLILKDPSNLQLRYDLSLKYYNEGLHQEAIEQLLQMISLDKNWNEGAAKQLILKIFNALGNKNPLVITGRSKLANLLFV